MSDDKESQLTQLYSDALEAFIEVLVKRGSDVELVNLAACSFLTRSTMAFDNGQISFEVSVRFGPFEGDKTTGGKLESVTLHGRPPE
jgi:hypothetical protein